MFGNGAQFSIASYTVIKTFSGNKTHEIYFLFIIKLYCGSTILGQSQNLDIVFLISGKSLISKQRSLYINERLNRTRCDFTWFKIDSELLNGT